MAEEANSERVSKDKSYFLELKSVSSQLLWAYAVTLGTIDVSDNKTTVVKVMLHIKVHSIERHTPIIL